MFNKISKYILNRKSPGFTLLELIAAIAIGSIIIVISYNLIFTSNRIFNTQTSMISIRNDIRILQDKINNDINNAQKINNTSPYEFIKYDSNANPSTIKYYYDTDRKAVIKNTDGKEEVFLKNIVNSFDIKSDDLKKFIIDITIKDTSIKSESYKFIVTNRNTSIGNNTPINNGGNVYEPHDYGYLMTLEIGNNPAGGIVVLSQEKDKKVFYEYNYEDGFDITIIENGNNFIVSIFGFIFTYNTSNLDNNHKLDLLYINNLGDFEKEIKIYNNTGSNVDIGYEDNKHEEIAKNKNSIYSNGKWKNLK